MTTRGIWCDGGPRLVLERGGLDYVASHGYDTAVLVSGAPGRRPTWPVSQAQRAISWLVEHDIEPGILIWPPRDRAGVDRLLDYVDEIAPAGLMVVELDLEGMWVGRRRDRVAPAAYLVERTERSAEQWALRWEVTTHPWHPECSRHALVAPHADRLVVQAYSIRRRPDGQVVEWRHPTLGPGAHQRWALARAAAAGCRRLSVGLAAWEQWWPGHTTEEAMAAAAGAVAGHHAEEVRWWSLRHLMTA